MLKIATEEAFSIPEVADALGRASRTDNPSLDMPWVSWTCISTAREARTLCSRACSTGTSALG